MSNNLQQPISRKNGNDNKPGSERGNETITLPKIDRPPPRRERTPLLKTVSPDSLCELYFHSGRKGVVWGFRAEKVEILRLRDPAKLSAAAKSNSWNVRRAVALAPATGMKLLATLSKDRHPEVREQVAKNPNSSPEILERLAAEKSRNVRAAVAGNPSTPGPVLRALLENGSRTERVALAKNPSLTPELLSHLFAFPDLDGFLAAHPKIDSIDGAVSKLAKSTKFYVRTKLAANPAVPLDVVSKLAESDPYVKAFALSNPKMDARTLKAAFEKMDEPAARGLANNPKLPTEIGLGIVALYAEKGPTAKVPGKVAMDGLLMKTNDQKVAQALLALGEERIKKILTWKKSSDPRDRRLNTLKQKQTDFLLPLVVERLKLFAGEK